MQGEKETKMKLSFKVQVRIAKPIAEVFEAVVNPKELSKYFTTGGSSGRIEEGKTIIWQFADFPGEVPVTVKKVVAPSLIEIQWAVSDGDNSSGRSPERPTDTSRMQMIFEKLTDNSTMVSIGESGWRSDEVGLADSYSKCSGWTQMQASLKAYLEHGINLRDGYYKA
jgi:uncharacterized protein YndB with AHSA1/START domain